VILTDTTLFTLERRDRFLVLALKAPHRAICAASAGGGERLDLTHLSNHQSCEGAGHDGRHALLTAEGPDGYHRRACADGGLPSATTVLLGTAANMQCAAVERVGYDELTVTVAATAGVHGNAARAGDVARWHEGPQGWRPVAPAAAPQSAGTINLLVHIDRPCSGGCLARALVQVSEAKSAALQALRVPSRQSRRLATGTGTDQTALAAPLPAPGERELTWAGHHSKLGELVARAAEGAITRSLAQQNGLHPAGQRSLIAALGRFGLTREQLVEAAAANLDRERAELLARNLDALIHDPQPVAAAFALAEAWDLAESGVLPREGAREAAVNQAALIACAIGHAHARFADYRRELSTLDEPGALAARAVCLGFADKW
jgi:adenosylcobinamide amidohydrolase